MSRDASDKWDFFVSYTQADRAWAEWIAWILEEDHYRVLIQAWDELCTACGWTARTLRSDLRWPRTPRPSRRLATGLAAASGYVG